MPLNIFIGIITFFYKVVFFCSSEKMTCRKWPAFSALKNLMIKCEKINEIINKGKITKMKNWTLREQILHTNTESCVFLWSQITF